MIENRGYHVHIYYNSDTKPVAERLREDDRREIRGQGRRDSATSHAARTLISQFVAILEAPEFQNIVPWLMLNRDGLDVLVHPLTESSYDDHSKNALWLGTPVADEAGCHFAADSYRRRVPAAGRRRGGLATRVLACPRLAWPYDHICSRPGDAYGVVTSLTDGLVWPANRAVLLSRGLRDVGRRVDLYIR